MDNQIEELKQHLHEQLALLAREYERAAKPLIDKLVEIEHMYPKPIFIDLNEIGARLREIELATTPKARP
jgi:hypothetical protein